MKFSVVIPVYNESTNILNLCNELTEVLKNIDHEIIIIDDCSTDDTHYKLKKINNDIIKIITNKKNRGQSFSIFTGIKVALNETIVTIDGDGQNDPKDILKLASCYFENEKISLVGGVRIKRKDTKLKIISSIIANKVRSFILKDQCPDTGCGLKIFEKKVTLKFPFFDGIHRFLPALFTGVNAQTKFIYVNHRPRIYGISKYNTFGRLIRGIIDIFKVKNIIKNLNKND